MPDFKTIADFRRDNGPAIRAACAQFVVLCRNLNLFTRAVVAYNMKRMINIFGVKPLMQTIAT